MGVKFKMWEERPITKKRGPRKRKTVRVWGWYSLTDALGE
jgi:hypothetical protein